MITSLQSQGFASNHPEIKVTVYVRSHALNLQCDCGSIVETSPDSRGRLRRQGPQVPLNCGTYACTGNLVLRPARPPYRAVLADALTAKCVTRLLCNVVGKTNPPVFWAPVERITHENYNH